MDLNNMPPTYATFDQAEAYFEWRLNADAWCEASAVNKARALVTATQAIDRLNFSGLRTSDFNRLQQTLTLTGVMTGPMTLDPSSTMPAGQGQPLEFPRNGETTIRQDIVNACCEIAFALLDGVDPNTEMESMGTTMQRFSSVHATFDPAEPHMCYRHGIPSYLAWTWLYPYLADPTEFNVKRVS